MVDPVAEYGFGSEYIDWGPDGGLLTLTGELDLASAPEFERALLEADGQRILVLDLRGLHFIDCASLRTIFRDADRLRRDGRRLVLVAGTNSVERTLRMVKAENLVEILDGVNGELDGCPLSPSPHVSLTTG